MRPMPMGGSVMRARHIEETTSLRDRLVAFAKDARYKASLLRPGAEQDALLKKARQADTALRISNWVNSAELRPPK